jgi:hypothetical protein
MLLQKFFDNISTKGKGYTSVIFSPTCDILQKEKNALTLVFKLVK